MTATQVFLMFLKKCLTHEEYMFFRNTIMYDNGNKYFKKRRLYKNDFVEGYLSRNNRALNNFMTRLFILAPNLKKKFYKNPRYKLIEDTWRSEHEGKEYTEEILREYIDDSEKKINSPFKKGESYKFKLKDDIRLQLTQ